MIRANAEFLQERQPASEEAAEIVSETDRLSSLVDSLLAVARGDGTGGAAHDELDLGAVVEGSAASMRSLATERGVALDVSAAPELRVRGSREQLRQLVVILVDNALRYTATGGHVDVDVARRDGSAVMAVTDTGIGIPPEALAHVFERFYRADEARTRDSGGAGLGLAIAQKLVDEHGGRISAESTPGNGLHLHGDAAAGALTGGRRTDGVSVATTAIASMQAASTQTASSGPSRSSRKPPMSDPSGIAP